MSLSYKRWGESLATTEQMAQSLPTKDEQLRLRETRNLMSTGILQLQMDEMLAETRKSGKKCSGLRSWLDHFTRTITHINPSSEITPLWLKNEGINQISFRDQNTSIPIIPPKAVSTIGSFPLQTTTNPFCNVDLVVSLPVEIFMDRDILNYSYFDKRNIYLGYLFWYISKQSDLVREACIGYLKNDDRKPIIVLEPIIHTPYSIRIFLAAPENVFKLNQLRPSKNNVRPEWWIDTLLHIRNDESRKCDELDPKALTPTPHYNMAILEDCVILKAHDYVAKFLDKCPWMRDIIIVIKVWLTQREFRWGIDTLDGHSVLFILIYLNLSGVILPHMTPLTGFMTFLKYILDLPSVPYHCMFLGKQRSYCGAFPLELYLPGAFDQNDYVYEVYNFLWRISVSALRQLKEHAYSSLRLLQSPAYESNIATSSFKSVFLEKYRFVHNYDLIFHISCADRITVRRHTHEIPSDVAESTLLRLDNLTSWQYTSEIVQFLLQESLGNRVTKVHIYSQPHSLLFGKVSSIFPVSGVEVVVGILLNSTHMHRRVDRGPAASEDVECAKFRQFWGQKSEMRRFKDGSIVEAVVWSDTDIGHNCGTVRPGHLISAIAGYIFNRHIPFCERIRMSTDQLADFLPQYSQNLPAVNLPSSNTMCHSTQQLFSRAIESVVVLRRILTSDLKGFPLVIENLRPSSAALRYTSLFPPVSNPLFMTSKSGSFSGERINPVSIVFPIIANLQKSSRWPSDLIATKSLKSALLVKLSSNLEAQFSISSSIHPSCLDIFFEGYVFRLYLFTDQELPLMAPDVEDFSTIRHASIQAKCPRKFLSFYRKMIIDPQHHIAVHTLCSRYESFSDTVRLLSLWVDLQSLTGYLDVQSLELIVASVYLPQQSSDSTPHCASFGLFKSLLRIAEYDWQNHPLLIDMSLVHDEHNSSMFFDHAYSEFACFRHLPNGGPCFLIAGKYDRNDHFYFDYGLSLCDYSIQNIAINAAKIAVRNITESLYQKSIQSSMSMLVTSPPDFDVTIFFVKSSLTNHILQDDTFDYSKLIEGPHQVQIEILQNIPIQELPKKTCVSEENMPHPFHSEYVATLRENFHQLALFFYNQIEGRHIGVVWKPHAFASRGFTALHSRQRSIVHEKSASVPNIASIISEMVALGKGIVDRVEIR